jgi:translation initiation factor 1A
MIYFINNYKITNNMPPKKSKKNIKKGGSGKESTRDLEFKQEMEEYAKVTALMGDRKIGVKLPDGTETLGIIPGKYRKGRGRRQGMWIAVDDVVLVSYRDYQDGKMDVLHKYTDGEVKNLIQYCEIPSIFGKSAALMDENIPDDGIVFEDETAGEIDFDDI